ncbi:CYTH domain-containing protein [Actinosynnema sp. CA-299493]
MNPEYEARFTNIDVKGKVEVLRDRGAVCVLPRTLMKRVVFKNEEIARKGGWLRLRDQGNSVTLTYKQTNSEQSSIDSILEAEVQVSDFAAAQHLLEAMGFKALRYQENYREEWELDGVKYDFDTWPSLPTFLEIEGSDEESVRLAAKALELPFEDAVFGSVDEVYESVLGRNILVESRLVFHE